MPSRHYPPSRQFTPADDIYSSRRHLHSASVNALAVFGDRKELEIAEKCDKIVACRLAPCGQIHGENAKCALEQHCSKQRQKLWQSLCSNLLFNNNLSVYHYIFHSYINLLSEQ